VISWIVVGVVIIAGIVGAFLWIRSEKRWQPPPASSPEQKEAEAELWSARNGPQF
jgi:uncharacterized membrane protein